MFSDCGKDEIMEPAKTFANPILGGRRNRVSDTVSVLAQFLRNQSLKSLKILENNA